MRHRQRQQPRSMTQADLLEKFKVTHNIWPSTLMIMN